MRPAPALCAAASLVLALSLAAAGPALASKLTEAEAAFGADKDQEAIRLYGEAIAESAADPEVQGSAYFGRGEVYVLDGKADAAIADFTAALGLQKDPAARASSYFSRGEVLSRRRQWDAALADYDEAVKLAPTMPGVHLARARVFRAQNRKDEAVKAYDAELKVNPDSYPAQSLRADLLGLPIPPATHPHHP